MTLWSIKALGLAISITALLTAFAPGALAISEADVDSSLPDIDTLKNLAKSTVAPAYISGLKSQAAKLKDYRCTCRLFTRKGNIWKDYGSAEYSYKYRGLFKALIKTKDYRNGSMVVREPSGIIKGCGGGTLSFMKITLKEDSRTLQLPTGYSLAKSDFNSLYDELSKSLSGGSAVLMAPSATFKAFAEPVCVIVLKNGNAADSQIAEVLYISNETKTPLGWHTFQNGVPHAVVLFQNLESNKGLTEDLFAL